MIFHEVKACKLLSDWCESRGWSVKRGAYGLETAFEARFSTGPGGRTVCFNAEYGRLGRHRQLLTETEMIDNHSP